MLVFKTLAAVADHLEVYLACAALAAGLVMGMNFYYVRRWIGGMVLLQIYFVFNTAIILFGCWSGEVAGARVLHFLAYELATLAGIYWLYRKILRHRTALLKQLERANSGTVSLCLLLFNAVLCAINFQYAAAPGASRIEFMTASWFSFFRPIMTVLLPLGYFFPIYLLDRGRRLLPLLLLGSSVTANVLAGSKASFLYGVVCALLFYEDLKGARLKLSKTLSLFLFASLMLTAGLALARLNVTLADMAERFVRTGESTIMVYYSSDPRAAAAGLSTLAKIHRGGAKLLGDASAADIDTLFGFALSRVEYGAHNFTGPNAQISSYMLCNYAGWANLIGAASILAYLALVDWFCRAFVFPGAAGKVFFLPFVVVSLNSFPQDYYQGMSDLTVIGLAALVLASAGVAAMAAKHARSIDAAA